MCSWHSLPAPFKQAKIKGAVDIAALEFSYLQQPSDSRLTEDKAHTPDQREGSCCSASWECKIQWFPPRGINTQSKMVLDTILCEDGTHSDLFPIESYK